MARRIAVQGTERNPFSANYFPPKSDKLRNWRKITPIPSIWMRKTTHLTDCGSSPSECKLFKSRTMTHTTQRAAGSSAPLRWPPVGKAYSIVDHSGLSLPRFHLFSSAAFLRPRLNVTLLADTRFASWYNFRFPGVFI